MPEKPSSPEFSESEKALIEKLRERGVGDPEARELLASWLEEREKEADEANTSRANIELNLKRAKLYLAAGLLDGAWETLNEVREQAENEGERDLYDEAMRIMDEIEPSKPS